MKALVISATLAAAFAIGSGASPAQAAGCIKGAIVGGLAGHLVHHGMLGAAAGCAIGHHEASKQAQTTRQNSGGSTPTPDNQQ